MTRVITGVLLAAGGSYLIFISPNWLFHLAALGVALGCYHEYVRLVAGHGIARPSLFGWLAGAVLIIAPQLALLAWSLLLVGALAWALRRDDIRDILPRVSAEFFGAIYTFL